MSFQPTSIFISHKPSVYLLHTIHKVQWVQSIIKKHVNFNPNNYVLSNLK